MIPGIMGAIIGLIGTGLSRATDIFEKSAEAKVQMELSKQNAEIAKLELEKERLRANTDLTTAALEARSRAEEANAKADSVIMKASYEHDKTISLEDTSKFGAFIRNIVRPLLTLAYGGMFLYVILQAISGEIIARQADMIFGAFIETAVGITLWWFGLRRTRG